MVRIGTVWDRTVEVIGGRTAMLAGIAVATLFVPTVVRDAWGAYAGTGPAASATVRIVGGLLSLLTVVVMLYGQLALTAVASDPATTRADAYRTAGQRFGAAIAVALVAIAVVLVLSIPAGVLLAASGFDFTSAAAGRPQTNVSAGALGGVLLYGLIFTVFAILASARLAVLWPVIVNERLGLGAFARSFRLTRGMTWKLIGVLILYAIVLIVALAAATSITGVVFRLALGQDNIATAAFLAAIAGAVVTTVFAVLQTVFVTQLYVALRGDEAGAVDARQPA